ncbi:transposase [Rhodovulum sp. 12E13]|uniref:IS66 family transposase n=1 Tax=Rhodovulum sp. 12E13 TaxID=2203891 RepID=UPI0018F739A3
MANGHGGADPPIVLFHYASGRGKQHPLKFLAGYRGRFLQCDAYQSYNALAGVNPVDYLADTLRAILDGHPKSRIEDLMPWRYAQPSSLAA